MAEFDFAPRPPRQAGETEAPAETQFGADTPGSRAEAEANPEDKAIKSAEKAFTGPKEGEKKGGGLAAAAKAGASAAAGGTNPLQGFLAMATLIGMARHTNAHVEPINSPTGLMSLLKGGAPNAKQISSDDHAFSLDATKHATAGGAMGGMNTAIGTINGPVQSAGQKDATNGAMKALGNMTRNLGGGMAATLQQAGKQAQAHMNWLSKGVKELYKIQR